MEKEEKYSYTKLEHPKNKGSAQLFKNPILEKLTHTHISAPLIIFSLVAIGLIYFAVTKKGFSALEITGLFFIGFFTFTLVEYLMHRYLYHIPTTTEFRRKMSYTMHGNHHDYPKDKMRLAMPPILGLVLATILFLFFWIFLRDYTYGFLAGFIIGYACYIGIHYILHAYDPPNNRLKYLWDHHSIHHYREDDRAFGVSSPLWDYVFGTMPRKGEELKAFREAQRQKRKAEKQNS